MSQTYLALLRGINVGGKNHLPMAELKNALTLAGFEAVQTYIQSGNVIFKSDISDTTELAIKIEDVIHETFQLEVPTVVFSAETWHSIIARKPLAWGKDPLWKHNLLVLLPPYDMQQALAAIGTIKPDIESIVPGDGVIYQSMSLELYGRTTTGKLASSPLYQRMTIRNFNTSLKLDSLLQAAASS